MTLMSLFRPLTPREMLRWTARIYSRYFGQWMVLGVLAVVPLVIVNLGIAAVLPEPSFDPELFDQFLAPLESGEMLNNPALQQDLMDDMLANSLLILQQVIAQLVAQIVILGTLAGGIGSVMAATAYRGDPVSVGDAIQVFTRRINALFTGHVIAGFVLVGLLLVSILGTVICIGVLGMGLTIYVYLGLVPLVAPVLVLEDGDWRHLMRRAWTFGKQRVWLLFGMTIVLYTLRLLLAFPLDVLQSVFVPNSLVVAQIITVLVELLVLPVGVIFFTLVYEDTRSRQEVADAEAPAASPAGAMQPPVRQPLLSTADLPNIVGISMLSLGLLFGFYFVITLRTMLLLS